MFIFVTFISVAFVWYMSCSHGVCVFENFIMGLHDSLLMCPQLSLIVCDDSEFKLVSRLSVLPNGCFWTRTQFNWSVNNNDNNDNRDDDDDDAEDNNVRDIMVITMLTYQCFCQKGVWWKWLQRTLKNFLKNVTTELHLFKGPSRLWTAFDPWK